MSTINRSAATVAAMFSLAIATTGCGAATPAPPASTQVAATPVEPAAPKIPAVGLYVTNESSGDLTIIDAASLAPVGTIKLGKRP
ncbi:MAG TPA: hypothetical protein VGG73_21280, partial [Vicinamibacterales bacterium]